AIYSGMTPARFAGGPAALLTSVDPAFGFRFLGQSFTPDGYVMGKLVFRWVGPATRKDSFTGVELPSGEAVRGLPRGLDVMASRGSGEARKLLHELGDDAYRAEGKSASYGQALDDLKAELGRVGDRDWNRNLYWGWLHSLQPLLEEPGAGYPTFM